MKELIIKTQKELDILPVKFDEFTVIKIISTETIIVRVARGNSSVEAWGNSSVEARENSSVVAWGNSSVVAWENSSVVAWGNSSVEARENSSVVARENSSVVAWGNSSVVAWENVGVHLQSDFSTVILFSFAVCWALAKGKITRKSKTAIIITPKLKGGTDGWLESQAIELVKKHVVLFKRVSKEWETQEGTSNATNWKPGNKLSHPSWNPKDEECGGGKYHACSRPYFCDEFRSNKGDHYVAIRVAEKDLYAWPNPDYPHKISFRAGEVLYKCDKFGKEIK
jgi:hypothetical protein